MQCCGAVAGAGGAEIISLINIYCTLVRLEAWHFKVGILYGDGNRAGAGVKIRKSSGAGTENK